MFDSLLLLGSGGTELYFGPIGPDASDLMQYFEDQGGLKCPPGANPAEWLIEVTREVTRDTKAAEEDKQSWSQKWYSSEKKKEVLRHLATLEKDMRQKATSGGKAEKYAASTMKQLVIVTKRIFQDYWRDPTYLYAKVALCLGIVRTSPSLLLKTPSRPDKP